MSEETAFTDRAGVGPGGFVTPVVDAARGWAVLTITGIPAERVTADVALQPDRVVSDDSGGSIWQLRSQLTGNHPIAEHLADLVARLYPVRRRVRLLSRTAEIIFHCVILEKDQVLSTLHIPPRTLLFAGYLGASIEIEATKGF